MEWFYVLCPPCYISLLKIMTGVLLNESLFCLVAIASLAPDYSPSVCQARKEIIQKELTISRFALVSGRRMCVCWGCSSVIRVEHTLWSGQIWRMTFKTPYCLSVRSLVLFLRPSRWLNAPQCGCQSPPCQTCEDEAGMFIQADETKQTKRRKQETKRKMKGRES